jgi:hypothetical protein
MGWLKRIFSRGARYDELAESIRQHLEEKTEGLIQEGLSREEAVHRAQENLGTSRWSKSAAGKSGNGRDWNPFGGMENTRSGNYGVMLVSLSRWASLLRFLSGSMQRSFRS